MPPEISVIIPVLNEAAVLGDLLSLLSGTANLDRTEIIVVDGGSTDNSVQLASNMKGVKVIHSPKGRAIQMNTGARLAQGKVLYFLHADTIPPKDFDLLILNAVKADFAGCFRLKFHQPFHFLLKIAPWFTRFRNSLFRGGDQSLFITKIRFDALNGYDERYHIYEDVELINRIYKSYSFKILEEYVITSARKFKRNGVWNLYFSFLMIHIKYELGQSPDDLYAYYKRHIQ